MKIRKKKGLHRVRLEHNRTVFWIIIGLIVLLMALIYLKGSLEVECVPSTCCHPSACVSASEAPDCSDVACTQECAPGTLDCGQGSCEFIKGECLAVLT